MASVNKAIILGNVTKDPEMRYTASGIAVASLSIATNFKTKDEERVEFHRITLWDKLATVVVDYVKKGDPLYVEGRIETRKRLDKDGNDRYTTEIVAERVQLLGRRSRDDGAEEPEQRATKPAAKPASRPARGSNIADMDDDVPF